VEIFGWNFSANSYSSPERTTLSSAAQVTAAKTVHNQAGISIKAIERQFNICHPDRSEAQASVVEGPCVTDKFDPDSAAFPLPFFNARHPARSAPAPRVPHPCRVLCDRVGNLIFVVELSASSAFKLCG
jgi:hypothetical protein